MRKDQWSSIHSWFLSYVREFRGDSGRLGDRQTLKLKHSLMTSREATMIASSMGFSPEDCILASIIGLLHDVARFEQWHHFRTFVDQESIDHGFLGSALLRASGSLQVLPQEEQELVLTSILHHNKIKIPNSVSGEALRWCHLVRDADKIDIYRVLLEDLEAGRPLCWDQVNPDLPLSFNVLRGYKESCVVDYSEIRSLQDLHLAHLSWVWGLHYSASSQRLHDSGYWERLKPFLSSPELDPLIEEADRHLLKNLDSF